MLNAEGLSWGGLLGSDQTEAFNPFCIGRSEARWGRILFLNAMEDYLAS